MKTPILLATLTMITGCMNQPQSEAAEAARIENKKTLIEATVQPGKDSRCVSVMGFQMCYERERTVVE